MMRCTAPVLGHIRGGGADCPVHGGRYGSSYSPSYYTPPKTRAPSGGGGSSGRGGGAGGRSTRPRWSPANSSVTYTTDEVAALERYRQKVEATGPRAESYDLFLCHAWDDRRGIATELHNFLEAQDVSVWFSERDIILGQPFMREIDKGLAKTRIGLVLITPAFLKRIQGGGVSEKELSELLARDLLIPVAHGVSYGEIREVSPLLGSRNGLNTDEDSIEDIAKKIAELVNL
ncbi:toll/interleukin-1 receptor domain-containing protein [Geodermatophilus sp. FMUSA9-8]|uniref:toll/interleukin-1 receptor domain-containing protein n=1 Tax=Geodermatophilus sp. FMUSA9-8 TaxID=3120155 RepID=UPI0030091D62